MNLKKLLVKILGLEYYTSPLDQFLLDFDESHPQLSASQLKEKQKYARIYQLRDHEIATKPEASFWPNF